MAKENFVKLMKDLRYEDGQMMFYKMIERVIDWSNSMMNYTPDEENSRASCGDEMVCDPPASDARAVHP